MKTLFLIRHAKSSWEHPEQPDFERPLTEQGITDVHELSKQLIKKHKIKPNLIICSNANRSIQTAEIFAKEFKYPADKIVTDKRIYTEGVEELVKIVTSLDNKFDTIFFIGHNPGLTWLTHFLADDAHMNITTCGIVGINFATDAWENIIEAEGKVLCYLHPHHEHPEYHKHPYEG